MQVRREVMSSLYKRRVLSSSVNCCSYLSCSEGFISGRDSPGQLIWTLRQTEQRTQQTRVRCTSARDYTQTNWTQTYLRLKRSYHIVKGSNIQMFKSWQCFELFWHGIFVTYSILILCIYGRVVTETKDLLI